MTLEIKYKKLKVITAYNSVVVIDYINSNIYA